MHRLHHFVHIPIAVVLLGILLVIGALPVHRAFASTTVVEVCPGTGIQPRSTQFQPGGIILTAFDRASMWVYNIDTNRRYPLPETRPCGTNCRLSPDARLITYVDSLSDSYATMRLDGTGRTPLVDYAADVEWWSSDMLLVWTPTKEAYLRPVSGGDRQYFDADGVTSIQPGGHWGVIIEQDGDAFRRALVDLDLRELQGISGGFINLGPDRPYFNASAWSPNGQWLAYIAPAPEGGGDLFGVQPLAGAAPIRWTELASMYGPVRINGRASGDLSWSPDGQRIAFWVMRLNGPNPERDVGPAQLHVLTIATGEVRRYCGFETSEHTPNPPRLVWSPDSSTLAFGGNVPGDDRGYLLLALNVDSGQFTELSEGLFPVIGGPNPIAWGYPP